MQHKQVINRALYLYVKSGVIIDGNALFAILYNVTKRCVKSVEITLRGAFPSMYGTRHTAHQRSQPKNELKLYNG